MMDSAGARPRDKRKPADSPTRGGRDRHMSNSTDERTLTVPERARELAVNTGQQVMSGLEWWLLRSSEIPTTPFPDRSDFPWAGPLEERWQDVRAELDTVLERREDLPNFQDILRDVAPISRDDQWK